MVNVIAQKFFDYIKEAGPTNGDAYDQDRLDEVDDAIQGYAESPVSLTEEEAAWLAAWLEELDNFDEVNDAIQALREADLGA